MPVRDPVSFLAGAVSSQRPSHSLAVGGEQLAFDARMLGVYLAFLAAFAVLGPRKGRPEPNIGIVLLATALGLVIAVDGINSLLDDRWQAGVYPPANYARFLAGAAGGVCIALMVRELGQMLWPVQSTTSAAPLLPGGAFTILAGTMTIWQSARAVEVIGLAGAITLYIVLALLIIRIATHDRSASWLEAAALRPWILPAVVSLMTFLASVRGALA